MVKVLIIDDDSHFRGIIERIILRSYTYSVQSVASEEEAWEYLSKNGYDLVILDLYIDGKKSWDTLKRIKALPSSPVVIMISCEDLAETAGYARALGAADFVPKPIDFGRLKTSVDAAVEQRRATRFFRRAGDAADAVEHPESLGLLIFGGRENRADTVAALSASRFRLFEVEKPGSAAEAVRRERVDAVLATMDRDPGPAGQFLASLREETPGTLRVPVIAVTEADPDRILAALRAGADDYVTLPFDPRILAAKVEAHVRFRREHEGMLKEASEQAVTDALTGLYTSAHFRARLEEEFRRSLRYGRDLALAVLKVDEKPDAIMQEERDRILIETSRVLRATLRNSDIVGRVGEDEFALILPETNAERVHQRAGGIRARVEERISRLLGEEGEITCRVGLTSLPRHAGDVGSKYIPLNPDGFLAMANAALANAKRSPSDRVEIFQG